jgi:hypothetical protein
MRREPYDRRLAQREEHFQERAHSVSRTDGRRRERAQPSTCQAAKADAAGGWEAQSKVRALAALVGLGPASPLAEAELRRLLEDVASDPPDGARGAQARLAALKALERLEALPDDGEARRCAGCSMTVGTTSASPPMGGSPNRTHRGGWRSSRTTR